MLGFVLGGVGPRTELAALDGELSRLQDELVEARSRAARRSPLSVVGLDRMGAARPDDEDPPPPAPAAPRDELREDADLDPVVVEDPAGGDAPQDMAAEFDAAVQAQRVRLEQTRAALIEQADLGAPEVQALDQAMAEMNDRLGAMGEDLLDLALTGEEPDSREMLALTHEVSGILYDAQVELDEIIGPEAVEEVDPSAREVWNYVDLDTFRDTVEAAEGAGWER